MGIIRYTMMKHLHYSIDVLHRCNALHRDNDLVICAASAAQGSIGYIDDKDDRLFVGNNDGGG